MTRKRFSARERERLFNLHGQRCYLCGNLCRPIERWELEHVVPWELTRDDSDDNVRPVHAICHREKTAYDIRGIRKADRQRQKHLGITPKSSRPMPGSKNSRFRKRMNGTVEVRNG